MEKLVTVPELVLKSTLKSHVLYELVFAKALEELKKITNIASQRFSMEFVESVCTLIEHMITNNKENKVDKKKLVVTLLATLFGYSAVEQEVVGKHIEYVLRTTKIVKTASKSFKTRIYNKVIKYVNKKKK